MAATLYVSSQGNDDWSGSLPAPNAQGDDGPFESLTRARDAIRQLRESAGEKGLQEPSTVRVRSGTYFLREPLWFGKGDGGSQGCPVTWAAYADEKPVLSGGAPVIGWTPWQGKILKAPAPERATWHGNRRPRQLFYKGRRQRRSRWPKFDPANPIAGGWIVPEGPVKEMEYQALHFPAGSFPRRWGKVREAEAVIYGGLGWCKNIIPLLDIDHERRILRLEHKPIDEDQQPWYFNMRLGPWNRFFIENVLEELSEPGDWYYDSAENMVYFWPPEEEFNASAVLMPVTDCLVRLRDAQWLTLRGLTFTCTTTGDDYHPHGVQQGLGAMMSQQGWRYCGEALHIRGSKHCVVEECLFDQVGGNAIYLERDNERIAIRRNEIDRAGFNGVVLAGDRIKHPRFCEVTDNDIHDIGRIINYVAGVFLGLSDSNVVSHNHIHDVPHHAVNLGANGLGRNYIEWNEIRRACTEIADTGAIGSWGDAPFPWVEPQVERSGHFIRWNLVADIGGCRVEDGKIIQDNENSCGIYLDDYTSNCTIWGNVFLRTGMGVVFHGGKHNVAENNIFVGCRCQLRVSESVSDRSGHEPMIGWNVGNRFCRNICTFDDPEAVISHLSCSRKEKIVHADAFVGQMDENLYHSTSGAYICVIPVTSGETYDEWHKRIPHDEWRQRGFDWNSVIADPLFLDPANDDYRLSADSPALKLGFAPIELSHVGIRAG